MKKIILISIAILLSSTSLFSQSALSKGAYTVGGSISYSNRSMDGDSDSHNNFVFAPSFGYFFTNNLFTGLTIQYVHYSKGDFSTDNIGFGPSLRYYFNNDKLAPFLGLSYLYNKRVNNSDDEFTNSMLTLSLGADYFITKYFAVEGIIEYSFISYKSTTDRDGKLFNIAFGAKYFVF